MKRSEDRWTLVTASGIILFSFFTFSESFFPLMNSDMAVNILMTPGFSFLKDIYFWGQDRSGSLIPVLAHPLFLMTGLSPALIVSLVHYLILVLGYFAAFRFVKTPAGRLILALVWFLPPWHFIEFLLILYGVQASCVMIALNLFDRSLNSAAELRKRILMLASAAMFIVSVWVSDMVLVSMLALLLIRVFYLADGLRRGMKLPKISSIIATYLPALFVFISGFVLIAFAKNISTPVAGYGGSPLAGYSGVKANLFIVAESFGKVMAFRSESAIESVFLWAVFALLSAMFFLKKIRRPGILKISENPWLLFFLFEALLILSAVMISGWVAANGAGRRYFTTVFASSWVFFIMYIEKIPESGTARLLRRAVFFVVLIASFSGFSRFYIPEVKPSRMRVLSPLTHLAPCGIIAEYWNAYISACPDPLVIAATPHDRDYVRNPALADRVMSMPNLFLIRDGWLEQFPDSLVQFNRTLYRQGTPFHIADAWLCRYSVGKK
jgi:hypothetical protein